MDIFNIQIVYTVRQKQLLKDNKRYAAIDLGINNLATVSSNIIKPFIINGKPLKSINQYFNKKLGEYESKNYINKIKKLCRIHKNKTNDYLHKASKYITNQLVSQNINTLIIGKNENWKQEVNIGKINNQNFVNIPHTKFINMLNYKCRLAGINVIISEQTLFFIIFYKKAEM